MGGPGLGPLLICDHRMLRTHGPCSSLGALGSVTWAWSPSGDCALCLLYVCGLLADVGLPLGTSLPHKHWLREPAGPRGVPAGSVGAAALSNTRRRD